MILAYLAHPVAGDVVGNLARAKLWLRWLTKQYPDRAFIAPWITSIEAGEDDSDPAQRERGLRAMELVAARCDEIWLVGPFVSEGMVRERNAHLAATRLIAGVRTDFLGLSVPPGENPLAKLFGLAGGDE